jgi:hypothetical protein
MYVFAFYFPFFQSSEVRGQISVSIQNQKFSSRPFPTVTPVFAKASPWQARRQERQEVLNGFTDH